MGCSCAKGACGSRREAWWCNISRTAQARQPISAVDEGLESSSEGKLEGFVDEALACL